MANLVPEEEVIEVEGVGGRKPRTILRRDLAEVIEPRAEEILQMLSNELRLSGLLPLIGSGIVLTGGAAQMEGLIEMGEYIFDVPVRRGIPGQVGGLTEVVKGPQYATAVGLLIYGLSHTKNINAHGNDLIGESLSQFGQKIKGMFENLF